MAEGAARRGSGAGAGRFSLDHLIALNDEIAALARAGLPLERGLRDVAEESRGGLGEAMRRLSGRLERGASLPEALEAEGDRFPPVYRAVVAAGLRAGRLPAALEGLAGVIRGYADARRAVGMALWYPLIVLTFAYVLFLFMVAEILPRFLIAFESLRVAPPAVLRPLLWLGETAPYWWPVLPVLLVVMGVLWAWSGRASGLFARGTGRLLRAFPWVGAMVVRFEAANFAQLLALLIEHEVPLGEAIVLAAEASGDPALRDAGRELAVAVNRGASPIGSRSGDRLFPPLLRWLLGAEASQPALVAALRQVESIYRGRARDQAEKIRVYLPTVFLFAIGMTATLLYGLTLFVPFTTMLEGLTIP